MKTRIGISVGVGVGSLITILGFYMLAGKVDAGNSAKSGLLGLSPSKVIERIGVPDSVGASAACVTFTYGTPSDRKRAPTIVFHEGCAVWMDPGFEGVEKPTPAPASGIYPGQPVADLLKHLESPKGYSMGEGPVLCLDLEDGRSVQLAHGLVIYVTGD